MSPLELQHALGAIHSRAAQTLIFRCLERRSPQDCAALYGIGVSEWEILFFESARALAGESAPLDDATRRTLASRLQAELIQTPAEPLRVTLFAAALLSHADEVQRLLLEAEQQAAVSPARAREGWLRRLAVVVIIGVSLFVWLRERNKASAPAPAQFPLPPRGLG